MSQNMNKNHLDRTVVLNSCCQMDDLNIKKPLKITDRNSVTLIV